MQDQHKRNALCLWLVALVATLAGVWPVGAAFGLAAIAYTFWHGDDADDEPLFIYKPDVPGDDAEWIDNSDDR